jgi:translation initiation factor IF-2
MVTRNKKTKSVKKESARPRPPIVVVIGHVDHGKTTLLDQIKKTNVAGKEAGGITQRIGAYEVEAEKDGMKQRITFLDTPGHEAFSGMRQRGVKVADVAVLVVAADDGVQPQTIEAVKFAQDAGIPMLVAFNKTDKPEADVMKIKKQLSEHGVQTEDWGGQIIGVEISAKTGKGIKDLLDSILLVAEMEDLKANPDEPASGVVLESKIDSRKGVTATLLVKNGTLRIKDIVATENTLGKIKMMEDFRSKPIKSAPPGTPTVVMGMESMPEPGQTFAVYKNTEEARKTLRAKAEKEKTPFSPPSFSEKETDVKDLRLLLKADSQGTLEALETILNNMKIEGISLKIVKKGVGAINENDIKDASVTSATILGFNSLASSAIKEFAKQKKVKISEEKIVYKLTESVREMALGLLPPKVIKTVTGKLQVIALFKIKKPSPDTFEAVFGAKVTDGKIFKGSSVEIFHGGVSQGKGKVVELQFNKNAVSEVSKPNNAGIHYKGAAKVELGDSLEAYTEEIVKQKV